MNNICIPRDCIEIIMSMSMDRLNSFEDYLNFSEACSSFRSFAREERRYQKPWVMLANKPGDKTRRFYSPSEDKIYNVHLPKVVRRSWCCGSQDGWLVFAHNTRGNFIYNPITRRRFALPTHQVKYEYFGEDPTPTQHRRRCPYFLEKVVFSTLPPSTSSSSSSCPLLAAAAISHNYKILVTLCSSNNNNNWHSFSPLTLEEEKEGLLSAIIRPMRHSDEDEGTEDGEDEDEEGFDDDSDDDDDDEEDDDDDDDEEEEEEEEDEDEEVDLKYRMYARDVTDIIFYKGEFYAVNKNGKLIVIEALNDHDFSLRRVSMPRLKLKRKDVSDWNLNYLVESCHGGLLLVVRVRTEDFESKDNQFQDRCRGKLGVVRYETKNFVVFRLDESRGEPFRWVKIESLGDQVLLLGKNYSKSISLSEFQVTERDITGTQGNCIYFMDDQRFHFKCSDIGRPRPYTDAGVYHLEDGHMDKLLPSEFDRRNLYTFKCQPIMFTPNL